MYSTCDVQQHAKNPFVPNNYPLRHVRCVRTVKRVRYNTYRTYSTIIVIVSYTRRTWCKVDIVYAAVVNRYLQLDLEFQYLQLPPLDLSLLVSTSISE